MAKGGQRPPKKGGPSEPPATPPPRKWVWFRNERGGRPKAKEEFDALPERGRAGLAACIERYLKHETRDGDVDNLGGGILEIRHKYGSNHHRVLFTVIGQYCVALTAFYKNQRKTPPQDLNRAKQRAKRWREVFGNENQ